MRVGVVADLSGGGGGLYQYGLSVLDSLATEPNDIRGVDQFLVLTNAPRHPAALDLANRGWPVFTLPPSTNLPMRWTGRILRALLGERLVWELDRRLRPIDVNTVTISPSVRSGLLSSGADMLFYTAPSALSFQAGIPYMTAVHDLQHRLNPRFPEVSANGQWERREHLLRNTCRFAVRVLADSEVGREDILTAYGPAGVTEEQVKVLPFVPPPYMAKPKPEEQRAFRARVGLPDEYLFYPAQFWPHKNHVNLIEALGLLREASGWRIPIVFSGSYSGKIRGEVFRTVKTRSRELGIESEVHCIGYLSDAEMPAAYAGATALVMPTFFGPTNIPVLEAWQLDCPVVTSDIRGVREQVGDAALLVDPESPEAIAEGIAVVWTDRSARKQLIQRGHHRLKGYTREDFRARLKAILEEGIAVVSEERAAAS